MVHRTGCLGRVEFLGAELHMSAGAEKANNVVREITESIPAARKYQCKGGAEN